jgi:hypothetical protein
MSYTLIHNRPEEHAPYTAVKSIVMEVEDERSLDEMLDAYKGFLLASGYGIKGDLVVEEYDEL